MFRGWHIWQSRYVEGQNQYFELINDMKIILLIIVYPHLTLLIYAEISGTVHFLFTAANVSGYAYQYINVKPELKDQPTS